jgi:hypothetical protein
MSEPSARAKSLIAAVSDTAFHEGTYEYKDVSYPKLTAVSNKARASRDAAVQHIAALESVAEKARKVIASAYRLSTEDEEVSSVDMDALREAISKYDALDKGIECQNLKES